ncbi:MAG: SDR family oxidoreductase [Bacteroidota bacterium]
MDLANQSVLVTGGAGWGVGGGVCEVLAELGARLIINDINAEKAEEAARKYPNAIAIAADISKDAEVDATFSRIAKEVGTITALVNNAGVDVSKDAGTTIMLHNRDFIEGK